MADISQTMMQIAVLAPPILLAVTIHEVAHGYVADKLGDPTARLAGRLTLNPIKHLDLVGTAVFFLTQMIGWAKPVPVNPYNLHNPKKDLIWVSLARSRLQPGVGFDFRNRFSSAWRNAF